MQLSPRTYFTIVRQLPDHTDPGTYYVRAVVRNSQTDEIIATVTLEDKGDRRFTRAYQLPADSSGHGILLDITTEVFTDSGYTTKSTNHYDSTDQILVAERWERHLAGPGGSFGDEGVDYKKIKKIIDEAFEKWISKIKIPAAVVQQVNLSAVYERLAVVAAAVAGIKIPEQEKVSLQPVVDVLTKEISDAKTSIEQKISEIPEPIKPEPIDISPIGEILKTKPSLEDFNTAIAETLEKTLQKIEASEDTVKKDPEKPEEIQRPSAVMSRKGVPRVVVKQQADEPELSEPRPSFIISRRGIPVVR